MGKVMGKIRLTNATDHGNAQAGGLAAGDVRTEEIEAIVDTGATTLVLPADVVERLGFAVEGQRFVKYADARREAIPWVSGVRLEILGRAMTCDALVTPAGSTALIGQIPLEALDLIVDPKNRDVRVNPESPDAPLLDLLGFHTGASPPP